MNFSPLLRALSASYQAFTAVSNQHVRTAGLTNAQSDVLATLGQGGAMTCNELGQATLITKGTLTGVLDRLEQKDLIRRAPNEDDNRSFKVLLTEQGQTLFQRVFQEHLEYLKPVFDGYSVRQIEEMTESLRALEKAFTARL